MGERVDLDAVQERNDKARQWAWRQSDEVPFSATEHFNHDVRAMVAELRELREQRDDLARRLADMAIHYANLLADQAGEP